MTLFVQQLLIGIGNGVIYASVALALVLIYRTTGILNFAQGEMALVTTYVLWQLTDSGVPIGAAVPLAVVVGFVMGALIERVIVRRVEESSALTVVIVTIGMFLAANSIAQFFFGSDSKIVPRSIPDKATTIADVKITLQPIALAGLLVLECLVLWLLLQRTKLGLALRAVSSNPDSSRLVGISTGTMLMAGWAIAAALGALGGAAAVSGGEALDASLMQRLLVFAFAAAAIGGFDSPLGAVVGGIIVGVANAMTTTYLADANNGVDWLKGITLVVPFGLIALVLLFRPTGLFGRRVVERV